MKIILLGCGYLGYNLTNELSQKVTDLMCIGSEGAYSALMYRYFNALDVFDEAAMSKIDFNDAIVIDTISLLDNHAKSDDEEKVLCEFEKKYHQLLNQLKRQGAKRFAFISSGAVYGNAIEPMNETCPICATNLYTKMKIRLEKSIIDGPLDYLIIRLASPYGGFRMTDKRQGVIPILIEKALNGTPFEMLKDATTVRDYFYMSDFANAIYLLAEKEINNEIVNVGSGKGYSLSSIMEVVKRTTGHDVIVNKVESDVPILDGVILNVDKLKRLTDFDCEISITTGVYNEVRRILTGRN